MRRLVSICKLSTIFFAIKLLPFAMQLRTVISLSFKYSTSTMTCNIVYSVRYKSE